MFEGNGITALYLNQDPQAVLKNKMGRFDEACIRKSYARVQGKYAETVTFASIKHQIGRKLQARTKTSSPSGFNIAPAKYLSVMSGLTQ